MTSYNALGAARQDRPLSGIGYMALAMAVMTVMDAFGRLLVLAGISVFQMLGLRSIIIIAVLLAVMPRLGGLGLLRTRRPWVHALRAVCGAGAPLLFFASVRDLPLADATALSFASTFLMTALSVPLLKERVGWHRWSAVVIGFVGVVIVTRPGHAFEPAALLAIGSSVCHALVMVIGRWMGPTEPVFRQVFFFNVGVAVASLPFLPVVWTPMSEQLTWFMAAMTVLAIVGQFLVTRAFVTAPIGAVAPFEFTALAWAAALGYLIWNDVPDAWVVTGSAIIVASGLYILHREAALGRRSAAAAIAAGEPRA